MPRSNPDARKRARFASRLTHQLHDAGVGQASVDLDTFSLRLAADRDGIAPAVIDLEVAYQEYAKASPLRRDDVLRRYVHACLDGRSRTLPDTFEDARGRLVYRVTTLGRAQIWRWMAELAGDGGQGEPVYRTFADAIVLELACDAPDVNVGVRRRHLASWRVTMEEAFAEADRNTRAMAASATPKIERRPSGLLALSGGDGYSASRIACADDVVAGLSVLGCPVLLAPHDEVLLVAGSEDVAALADMPNVARRLADDRAFACGSAVLRIADGRWAPYVPADDAPHGPAWRALERTLRAQEYADQQAPLAAMAAAGRLGLRPEVFVASAMARRTPDGAIGRTACAWTAGLTTALPRTDDVCLVDLSADRSTALRYAPTSWDTLVRVIGGRMRPLGVTPERYLVESFPSAEELRAMGVTRPTRTLIDERQRVAAEAAAAERIRRSDRLRPSH